MVKKKLEEFYEKEAAPALKKMYQTIDRKYIESKKIQSEKLAEYMKGIWKNVSSRQKEGMVEPLGAVLFQLLRMDILQGKLSFVILGYGSEWYAGKEYLLGEWNMADIFWEYTLTWKELEKKSIKYMGRVTKTDIRRIMLDSISGMERCMLDFLRYSRRQMLEVEEYKNVQKAEKFVIGIGEYYEPPVILYTENTQKQMKKIRKQIKKEHYLRGKDYRKLSFRGMTFQCRDLSDTDFEESDLSYVIMEECILSGVSMRKCSLKGAVFKKCVFNMTDFTESDFMDATVESCVLYHEQSYRIINEGDLESTCP